jgi:hypothetical protein
VAKEAQKEGEMTGTYDQPIATEEQAASIKAALAGARVDDSTSTSAPTKVWHHVLVADAAVAVTYANTHPAQGAGEAVFSVRDDGQVDVFAYW